MASCAKPASAPLLRSFVRVPTTAAALHFLPTTHAMTAPRVQPHHRTIRTRANVGKKPILDKKGNVVVTKTIERMPFQAYQLALEIIHEDRKEKRKQIAKVSQHLREALAVPDVDPKARHILSLQRYLERLRILADINNPRVKYNFDNGIIGVNKPIYRYLANKKWREMERPILMQRLEQMKVIPDLLPYIDPVVDVQVRFRGRDVRPGTILDTRRTETQPTIKIVPFEVGEMLCTVAVVDPDVPDPEKDRYKYRLHWLVCNVPISHTQTQAIGHGAKKSDFIVSWLPPHCQRGIPYHRYALIVFKQKGQIPPEEVKVRKSKDGSIIRDHFKLRSIQSKHDLEPIGAFMWRNVYDVYTKEIMEKHNLPGADIMWKKVTSLMGEAKPTAKVENAVVQADMKAEMETEAETKTTAPEMSAS